MILLPRILGFFALCSELKEEFTVFLLSFSWQFKPFLGSPASSTDPLLISSVACSIRPNIPLNFEEPATKHVNFLGLISLTNSTSSL